MGQILRENICVRQYGARTILKFICEGYDSEEAIKYITDDLLGDMNHRHVPDGGQKWSRDHESVGKWDGGSLAYELRQLAKGSYILPLYLIEGIFRYLDKEKEFIYSKFTNFLGIYDPMLSQRNISDTIIIKEILWLQDNPLRHEKETYPYVFAINSLEIILENPACPRIQLLSFCSSEYPELRMAAIKNPNCPQEGKVIAALLGSHKVTESEGVLTP